jgi:glycosyltransferase involved in cell wall biosynthesis
MMKVIHLNHSDITGGAARAAYRIHQSLREAGIDSTMWVNKTSTGDWTVTEPKGNFAKVMAAIRPRLVGAFTKLLKTDNKNLHSPSIFPAHWVKQINESDADIIHLHWTQGEMLSISDIGRIKKPITWTLHDMWAFCGAEHYTNDHRWREGYHSKNRPAYESGFDLNRWTWKRKRKQWRKPIHIVTPSIWLSGCASQSALMKSWDISTVANPINTNTWKPIDKRQARELLGLPKDAKLLLFGAMGGMQDERKGFDLLMESLNQIRNSQGVADLELVVFGQLPPKTPPDLGFPVHFTGHLHDDLSLRALYSAADVLVIPSRQDNLPNTGIESHACGTPVVAFNIGGLPDIVDHLETGYLAKPFEAEDLAKGIQWVFQDKTRPALLGEKAMQKAEAIWSNDAVSKKYIEIYESILHP